MTHRQYPPQTINRASLLAGLVPVFSGWTAPNPGTNSELVNELQNVLSVVGQCGAVSTITYDLLFSRRIVATLRTQGLANHQILIRFSEDNITYYDQTAVSASGLFNQQMIVGKCRYVRYAFSGAGVELTQIGMRAYQY